MYTIESKGYVTIPLPPTPNTRSQNKEDVSYVQNRVGYRPAHRKGPQAFRAISTLHSKGPQASRAISTHFYASSHAFCHARTAHATGWLTARDRKPPRCRRPSCAGRSSRGAGPRAARGLSPRHPRSLPGRRLHVGRKPCETEGGGGGGGKKWERMGPSFRQEEEDRGGEAPRAE